MVVSYDIIMKAYSHIISYGETKTLPPTIDGTYTQGGAAPDYLQA